MVLRRLVALTFCLTLVAGSFACSKKQEGASPSGGGGEIAWMGYTEGMAKASETGKPVMVDYYTSWCKYCKMLDETTYKDPEIISIINSSFIAIKVDAEGTDKVMEKGKEMTKAELAKAYNVTGFPTIWFFDEKGQPISPLPGYSAPEEFKPVLTFISSGSYSKGIKYADYLESLKGSGQQK